MYKQGRWDPFHFIKIKKNKIKQLNKKSNQRTDRQHSIFTPSSPHYYTLSSLATHSAIGKTFAAPTLERASGDEMPCTDRRAGFELPHRVRTRRNLKKTEIQAGV